MDSDKFDGDLLFSIYDLVVAEHGPLTAVRNLPSLFRGISEMLQSGKLAHPSELVVFVHGHYAAGFGRLASKPVQPYLEPALYTVDGQIVSLERFEQLREKAADFSVKAEVDGYRQ